MEYNKLVRDKIPDIIMKKGEFCVTRTANDAEYGAKLKEKLKEEVKEYFVAESMEELADVREVLAAIMKHKGFDEAEVQKIQDKKRKERGGFDKRIILEES